MKSKIFPYIVVGFAGAALLAVAVLVIFIPVLFSKEWPKYTLSSTSSADANVAVTQRLPDPLITVVPKDQQSAENKTKVFVSNVDPKLGAEQPKVFVILFGAWSDAATQTYLSWANEIVQEHPQDVAFIWKDYLEPNTTTDHLTNVALTAHCLNEQAVFWPATQELTTLTQQSSIEYSKVLPNDGIDHGSLEECVTSKEYQAAVSYGYYYGQSLGVTNSHTIFINDAMYTDVLTKDQLTQYINEVLNRY